PPVAEPRQVGGGTPGAGGPDPAGGLRTDASDRGAGVKTALICGITGQDGSYLAELLLAEDYHVHGIIRRASTFNTHRIEHLYHDPHSEGTWLTLHHGALTDGSQLARLIREIEPDEIYNLAAQSHVAVSFEQPEYTGDVTGLGVTRLLEAIRETGVDT